jgi:hypothetical protein
MASSVPDRALFPGGPVCFGEPQEADGGRLGSGFATAEVRTLMRASGAALLPVPQRRVARSARVDTCLATETLWQKGAAASHTAALLLARVP